MSKTYEGMTVRQAAWKIEEDEASAKRLFKRYIDTAKKRAKTFEQKGMTSSYGYRRLQETLNEASYGFSAEALSHVSFTLSNYHTSYQREREAIKKAVDKMNVQWAEYDKETGKMIKPFITVAQFQEFAELMELYKSIVSIYSSEQVAKMAMEYIDIIGEKKLDWKAEKQKLLEAIDKATENKGSYALSGGKFSIRQYTTHMHERAEKK